MLVGRLERNLDWPEVVVVVVASTAVVRTVVTRIGFLPDPIVVGKTVVAALQTVVAVAVQRMAVVVVL